jgi:DNA primase
MKTILPEQFGTESSHLTEKIIELIKTDVPIEEVVGEFSDLRKYETRLIGSCPFCDESPSSFSVYPESKTFYCSRCLKQGDVFQFIMEIDQVSFRDALKIILTRYAGI